MSQNTQWDGVSFDRLDLPYSRINNELDTEPRFIRGTNAFITTGGKLSKRPGLIKINNTSITQRCDKMWIYETLDTPPKVYILGSFYNVANAAWEMKYIRLDAATPAWTSLGSTRNVDKGRVPHEVVVARGLAFVKTIPTVASGEKYGTVIFDGSPATPIVRLWGVPGPTAAAALKGSITKLNGNHNSTTTTITVDSTATFPATPFIIQAEFEEMSVSAKTATTFTVTRGVNGTTAASHNSLTPVIYRNWSASDHRVDVRIGWKYSYCYKSITGHYSNRAPIETNPDKLPSVSGPFQDQKPVFTLTGNSDTTNIPTIAVLRTTDGGGDFFLLEEIANPGAGTFDYIDDSLGSGALGTTFNDPLPDDVLGGVNASLTPDLTSNSVPPTVVAPKVVGTDFPDQSSSLAHYAGRIWFGIGNTLFFSSNEELNLGVPEEAFPSGLFGNFFRFQYPITNVVATTDALYVLTLQATYMIDGNNKETFNPRPIIENVGHPYGHPRAAIKFGERICFAAHDFRICFIEGTKLTTISDPLYTDIIDAVNGGAELDIKYWADLDKEWIIVCAHRQGDTTQSRQWIYDLKKSKVFSRDFWAVPWTIKATATASGRIQETLSFNRRLVFFVYDATTTAGILGRMDPTVRTGSDVTAAGSTEGYDFSIETNLMLVPAGNHVNERRVPGLNPTVYEVIFDRMLFNGDDDPQFFYYLDDLWTDPISVAAPEDPSRRNLSKGYKTMIWPIHSICKRVALKITKINSKDLFEILNLTVIHNPDAGS